MKSSVLPILFFLSGSTLVAAGPIAAIASIGARVASTAVRAASGAARAGKAASRVAKGAKKGVEAKQKIDEQKNKKKGKRDVIYDADEFESMLVARDHSIQEWIDLVYNPSAGTGISKEIVGLLNQLGRNAPPPGSPCPTKTNQIPQFQHNVPLSENKAIPREESIIMLKYMLTTQNPAEKVLFASLEVAMQLNCWTIPADVKAIVDQKGWMSQLQGAPSTASSQPAPRSIDQESLDSDFEIRDLTIEDDLDLDLATREAEHDDAESEFDLWTRDAEEHDQADIDLWSRDLDSDIDADLSALFERDSGYAYHAEF